MWDAVSVFVTAAEARASFLRKTVTSVFERTSHIQRSSKITHTALNINGFRVFFPFFF